jgi:hypothetical protein
MQKFCKHCKSEIIGRDVRSLVCFDCLDKTYVINGGRAAAVKVKIAIRKKLLPPPTDFKCMDCGVPATCYDHRDYNKPLDVQPVCSRCNTLRGSAIPTTETVVVKKQKAKQNSSFEKNVAPSVTGLTKARAIELAGSSNKLAKLLDLHRSAIFHWKEIPVRRMYELKEKKPEWFK